MSEIFFSLPVSDFNLETTLDSGQVFGFVRLSSGIYEGWIGPGFFRLRQNGATLKAERLEGEGGPEALAHYFDLERDLAPVYRILREEDRFSESVFSLKGTRLIRQDAWEALAGFILSSNNNVKRIQGIWRNLCGHGKPKGPAASFPSPRQIACLHERTLRQLGLGYRAPFLLRTAQFVAANPVTLKTIREASYLEAKERVLCFPGIGPKVADCVLLYGFQKYEAFPVDVWILRAMRRFYFRNRRVSEEKIHRFAQKRWKNHAGYVQQYLFHGARMGILTPKE